MLDLERILKAAAMMREATDLLSKGPLSYYLEELAASHELLMTRFAPIKVGDRVRLTRVPNFESAPGSVPSKHFLVVGALGTVRESSCGRRGFRFSVEFDDESWIDRAGSVIPIEPKDRHTFSFGENSLAQEGGA